MLGLSYFRMQNNNNGGSEIYELLIMSKFLKLHIGNHCGDLDLCNHLGLFDLSFANS